MTPPSRLPEARRSRYAANAETERKKRRDNYHKNKKLKGHPDGQHRLTGRDTNAGVADCAICGRVQIKLKGRAWRCANAIIEDAIAYNYGITGAEFRAMLSDQGNACAVCHAPFEETKREVDHDHACCPGRRSCGKCVRKILCARCNNVLGKVDDDIGLLLAMAEYLKGFKP